MSNSGHLRKYEKIIGDHNQSIASEYIDAWRIVALLPLIPLLHMYAKEDIVQSIGRIP